MRMLMHIGASGQKTSVLRAEVSEKCPYASQARSWVHSSPLYGPSFNPVIFFIKNKPVLLKATGATCPYSASRDNQKRGPPYSRLTA